LRCAWRVPELEVDARRSGALFRSLSKYAVPAETQFVPEIYL
jgi:hypothetical protein